MTLEQDGAQHHPRAALPILPDLEHTLAHCPPDRAGTRLHGLPDLAALVAAATPIGALAARHLGLAARPVRAILFDKTAATSWSLGWH